MNVMEALAGRTSVRHYKSQPVEAEKREQVANAFRLAPSARNLQNWKLLWVESPERKANPPCWRRRLQSWWQWGTARM